MPRLVRFRRFASSFRVISSASGPCERANAAPAASPVRIPGDLAQPSRVAEPDGLGRSLHPEDHADVLGAIGFDAARTLQSSGVG